MIIVKRKFKNLNQDYEAFQSRIVRDESESNSSAIE